MISYRDAIERLLAPLPVLPSETCALADATGRVLADTVTSPLALPSFDHAAMDGYALKAGASSHGGSEHHVRGSQAAGDSGHIAGADVCEIMTGARLPDGLDAVIAVERTEMLRTQPDGTPHRIRLLDDITHGRNVRRMGTDVPRGADVLAAGTGIEPAQIMLLAALGIAHVAVVRRPRVAIVCTGKELQTGPPTPLRDGQIHNSNGPYLTAALGRAGAEVVSCETVDDTVHPYLEALQRAVGAGVDLLISTGAVSMGRYDFVPAALRHFGAQVLFHKVAMRPGKPLLAARLHAGPLVLALPGTPMAVAVGARFFVAPVLRAMRGQGSEPTLRAVLASAQHPKPGLRHFLRATLWLDDHGQLQARAVDQQEPFRIQPFANADAWIVLDEHAGDCAAGMPVEIASLGLATSLRISAAPPTLNP
ncbi:MAG TPA: gephyrin-like molybdotransferase Glp [Rhodanobacter sp.]|nr:gephyrin-like molybdotransferase Glp [Rhodanobacter sp.]